MYLHIAAFHKDALIPKAFTADGADRSPALAWSGAPEGTRAFALVMDDPDAPAGLWTHWLVHGIPAAATGLPEALPALPTLPDGTRQGRNTSGRIGYQGPAPPPGTPHRYVFHLYALSAPLDLPDGSRRSEMDQALRGKILAEASWMGKYGR